MDPVDPELNVSNVKVEIKSDSSTEKPIRWSHLEMPTYSRLMMPM